MKIVEKEVKSKGDVLGKVKVHQFETTAEAAKHFGDDAKAAALINRQHMADVCNEFRSAQTRTTSPVARLSRLAKTNPELEKKINALLEKYGEGA